VSCSVWPLSLLEAAFFFCYSSTALAGGYSCVTLTLTLAIKSLLVWALRKKTVQRCVIMLCKERKKHTSIKVQKPYLKCCCKACAWNRWYCFNVHRMHLELRVYLSLTAECTPPCIASICVMLFTLQSNIIWIAYTPMEIVQIQKALTSLMSFMCCL